MSLILAIGIVEEEHARARARGNAKIIPGSLARCAGELRDRRELGDTTAHHGHAGPEAELDLGR